VSEILKLRDYQRGAIDALYTGWNDGRGRLAVVLPTGAGKTVVFAHLVAEHVANHPGERVIVLVHTDELVSQAARKLHDVAPHLSVGIVKAARNEVHAQAIVASVQSLRNERRRNLIKNVGLVIVDECHHATAQTYKTIMEHYGCYGGASVRTAGFTATLSRGDRGDLSKVWDGVAYRKDIAFMIRQRYLVNVRGKRIEVDDLDLAKVKQRGGDYGSSELGEALEASLAPETVAKAYIEHAADRSGILFAPTVSAAYAFADALAEQGVKVETVHGALPTEERRAILRRLADGTTQVVANCMVLTEGFDSPRVSCVVVARPTRHAGLYQQMVGRGLRVDHTRPWQAQDCLILDVVGVSALHGLASLVDLTEKPVRRPGDDDSLIDLLDELEEGDGPGEAPDYIHHGPVKAVDFDPLAGASKLVWGRTPGGAYFLSAGIGPEAVYVFILPAVAFQQPEGYTVEPDTFDVSWCTKNAYQSIGGHRGAFTAHRGVPLETAFAWGEDVAQDMTPFGSVNTLTKSASWRRTPPSQAQRDLCRSRGIDIPEGASKGDVSVLIDAHMATQRIDPIVKALSAR
jgi:superfamily II DNA or RNA helicase